MTVEGPVTDGNFLEISVLDTGVGIVAEDLERSFEEFYQVKGGLYG